MDLRYGEWPDFQRDSKTRMAQEAAGLQEEDKMANQIGDRYVCSDARCGCEVEIVRPCQKLEPGEERQTERARRLALSSELSTPPSAVNEPRVNAGLQEGAGERGGPYGSPKLEEGGRGPFRSEEDLEGIDSHADEASSVRMLAGGPSCFCGSPMILSRPRSSSAGAGTTR